MGRTVTQNADLRFRGRDDGASKTIKKVKDQVRVLPEGFAKSASALNMFSSASDKMGGSVADATAKLTNVAGLVMTGGPVGIAIAAITAGVAAATWAWSKYGDETETTEEKQKRLNDELKVANDRLDGVQKAIKRVSDELAHQGRTTAERAIADQRELVAGHEKEIRTLEKERAHLKLVAQNWRALTDAEQGWTDAVGRLLGEKAQLLKEDRELLRVMEEQQGSRKIEKRDTAEATEAEKRLTKVKREAATAAKQLLVEEQKATAARIAGMNELDRIITERGGTRQAWILADAKYRIAQEKKVTDEKGKLLDEETRRFEATQDRKLRAQQAFSTGMVSAMGAAATSMITDSENAHKHMINLALDAVETAIMAYALQGGAAAGASVASVPPLVPIVSAAVIGVIRALLTQMPSYQYGGVVPGVDTGRDTVIAAMRPNERVFSPEHNERMVRAMEGGAGGGVTVIFQSLAPPTSAEASRAARVLSKQLRRARSRGF